MFNWDEFKNGKVAVNCDTEEKSREFIKECHERGMKWFFLNINDTNWSNFKESTCYSYSLNSEYLKFGHKSKFEAVDYKIIKWESEKMKLRCVDNEGIESWLTPGNEYEIMKESYTSYEVIGDDGVVCECCKSRFELVEEPTEFTFQEVIARIKEGEVYVNTNPSSRVEKLSLKYGKEVLIIEGNYKGLMHNEFGIILEDKFKLQKPKKIATIYRVEHKKDGKKYDFISSQRLEKEMFVVCDTSQGKSYGRIVDIETRELTEEEIKQYKECWGA